MTSGSPAIAVLGQTGFGLAATGNGAAQMNTPVALTIDTAGTLWVADQGNHRVLRFEDAATLASGSPADQELGQPGFGRDVLTPHSRKIEIGNRHPQHHIPPMPSPAAPSATHFDLHNEDCISGLRAQLEPASVDLVVTSPPYNLDIAYSQYADDQARTEYLAWCDQWLAEVARVLKPDGSFFLNLGSSPSNPYLPHEFILRTRDQFVLQNTFHWIKSISLETDGETITKGHFKPINSPRYVNDCHEFVFHLTKSGKVPVDRKAVGVPYVYKSNIARWGHTGGEDKRCRGNNWFIPYKTIQRRADERPHPATFPVELAEKCILLHGAGPQSTMLDPFLGLGSSAIAAERHRIGRFIGFEIDPEYLRLARQRIEDTQAQVGLPGL